MMRLTVALIVGGLVWTSGGAAADPVAVETTGDARADYVAVSGTGDAQCGGDDCLAVSGTGDSTAGRCTWYEGQVYYCARGHAVSGTGDASCLGAYASWCVAASGTGNATTTCAFALCYGYAFSGTGHARAAAYDECVEAWLWPPDQCHLWLRYGVGASACDALAAQGRPEACISDEELLP